MMAVFLLAIILLSVNTAHGDFYKYTSSDGVECYTDSPKNRKAVLVLREAVSLQKARRKAGVGKQAIQRNPETVSVSKTGTPLHNARALPVAGVVTSRVGLRNDPFDGVPRNHNGIDIAVSEGTPVIPVAPGFVSYCGVRNGYGNIVIVTHDDGMTTIYAHNSANLVHAGMRVDGKSPLAYSGSTGRSTGPHLHFEAWRDGENITSTFLGGTPGHHNPTPAATSVRKRQILRKVVMADGTVLLTNLPLFHP